MPAASESERPLPSTGPEERRAFASTFDQLIASNLALTASVEHLVRTMYVSLGLSTLGVGLAVVAMLRR